jgi:hypothetical protein
MSNRGLDGVPLGTTPRAFSPVNTQHKSNDAAGSTAAIGSASLMATPVTTTTNLLSTRPRQAAVFTFAAIAEGDNEEDDHTPRRLSGYGMTTTTTTTTTTTAADENAGSRPSTSATHSSKSVQFSANLSGSQAAEGEATAKSSVVSRADAVLASSAAAQQALSMHRRLAGSAIADAGVALSTLLSDPNDAGFVGVLPSAAVVRAVAGWDGGGGASVSAALALGGGAGSSGSDGPSVPSGKEMLKQVLHIPKSVEGVRKAFGMPFERLKFVQRDW